MTLRFDAVQFQGSWVSPSAIAEYLQKRHWIALGGRNGTYMRFRPPVESGYVDSVLLPLDSSKADFMNLLDDALASIAVQSNIADERLLLDLDVGVGDKISFHKEVATPHGSIPWLDGEQFVTSSTRMLIAAAKAERQRISYFGNRNRAYAKAYLEAIRMGQTELGSYIITAFSPVEQIAGVDLPLPDLGSPMTGRAVAQTLVGALKATRESIDYFNRRASLSVFEDAVDAGASYELSRSLIGLIRDSNGANVRVRWDSVEGNAAPDSVVEFEPSDTGALERAAARFVQTAPSERVTVLGTVTLLDRPRPRTPGVFRLNVLEGSQAKKIRVRVAEQMYELAIQAFREGRGLLMSGRQEKEGQLWWLYDPEDIRIVPLPQLSLFDDLVSFEEPGTADEDEDD